MLRHASILSALLLLGAGCGPNETACAIDSDCFRGEVCVNGFCAEDPNGTSNSTSSNSSNSSTNGTNSIASAVCSVDPFDATCDVPDENDDSGEYVRMENGPPGCDSGWDDFEGGELTIENVQLCALEVADKYSTNLIPCDNKTFVVEATITPLQDCDHDDYTFDMNIQGNDCEEPNDRVRCEELEGGAKKVTAFVDPSISIARALMTVAKGTDEDAHFDYEIHLLARE